jgi:hypothetical protein
MRVTWNSQIHTLGMSGEYFGHRESRASLMAARTHEKEKIPCTGAQRSPDGPTKPLIEYGLARIARGKTSSILDPCF